MGLFSYGGTLLDYYFEMDQSSLEEKKLTTSFPFSSMSD